MNIVMLTPTLCHCIQDLLDLKYIIPLWYVRVSPLKTLSGPAFKPCSSSPHTDVKAVTTVNDGSMALVVTLLTA